MMTTKQSARTLAVLLIWLTGTSLAQAFYNPSQGRWLNRDPIGDGADKADTKRFEWKEMLSLYAFVHNNSVDLVDNLGLLTFSGCTEEQRDNLQQQFDEACDEVKREHFAKCLEHCNIPGRLAWNCDNSDDLTVVCHQSNDGSCVPGKCGYSFKFGSSIHICPDGLGGGANCPPYKRILMHELTHVVGHWGEKWPDRVTACMSFDCPSSTQ